MASAHNGQAPARRDPRHRRPDQAVLARALDLVGELTASRKRRSCAQRFWTPQQEPRLRPVDRLASVVSSMVGCPGANQQLGTHGPAGSNSFVDRWLVTLVFPPPGE